MFSKVNKKEQVIILLNIKMNNKKTPSFKRVFFYGGDVVKKIIYTKDNLPNFAKEIIQILIDRGVLNTNYSISEDILPIILSNYERGVYD